MSQPMAAIAREDSSTTTWDLAHLFEFLACHHRDHAPASALHRFLEPLMKTVFRAMKDRFLASQPVMLGEIGAIILPYHKTGAVDSLDLFDLDELILFSYYYRNRVRYRRVLDIGANVGLHSIVLAKCGYHVAAYEPDPTHYAALRANLALNDVTYACQTHQAAVSDHTGGAPFVRVLGNTRGSHIVGSKPSPYGALEYFDVATTDMRTIAEGFDLAKIDAESHEHVILRCLPLERWQTLDAFVEVGKPDNAKAIFAHFEAGPVRIFAQRGGWERVDRLSDMPTSYRGGSVFLSVRDHMDW